MPWTTDDIPNQVDRVAVVTGANGGLGFATAAALAGAGAHVIMAARDEGKATRASGEIHRAQPDARLETVVLDLASLASVESAAVAILGGHRAVDVLVNNAGVMAMPERRTEDGFEMQLGVNHLGHWALTAHLMPALLRADAARVVTVTSTAHHFGRALDPDDPHMDGSYSPWRAYGRSKLANYHFALGLNRAFERAGVAARSLVAHPGLAHTNLQVRTVQEGGTGVSGRFWQWMARNTGMDAARGALPLLRAATDPDASGGEMYAPRWVNRGAAVRRPILRPGRRAAIERLWHVSERETGIPMIITGTPAPD